MDKENTRPIDIMLADSNPLVLSAMSEIFERDPRFSLVATSATAEGFLGMVMRVPVDVGVIDWNLPALGGAKLIEVLREQENAPKLVVYGDDAGDLPRLAMAAGAAGFLPGPPRPRNGIVGLHIPPALLDKYLAGVATGAAVSIPCAQWGNQHNSRQPQLGDCQG